MLRFCIDFKTIFHDFGSILPSFYLLFALLFSSSISHRFLIDFWLIFDAFLHAQNHVFYCKTNSFGHFRFFWKNLKNQQFSHPFWHHFGIILASFFDTFSASIFGCLFGCHFFDFWSKMAPKMVRGNLHVSTLLAPRTAPKTHPQRNLDVSWILDRLCAPFWTYFDDFGINFGIMSQSFYTKCLYVARIF